MYRSRRYSGLNPPVPSASQNSTSSATAAGVGSGDGDGRRLLTLVRSLERKSKNENDASTDDDGDGAYLEEAVGILQGLIASGQRSGILGGNQDAAERVLAAAANSNASPHQGNNNGISSSNRPSKKARRGNNNGNRSTGRSELCIHEDLDDQGEKSQQQPATTADANHLVSAVLRILQGGGAGASCVGDGTATNDDDKGDNGDGKSQQASSSSSSWMEDRRLLAILAADLLAATGEYVLVQQSSTSTRRTQSGSNKCMRAEYELLAVSGKQLLSGLERTIRDALHQIGRTDDGLYGITSRGDSCDEPSAALTSCFRAAAVLVRLFGPRLSRSTAILAGLRGVAWESLVGVPDEEVVYSASVLLSALPLAGGKNLQDSAGAASSSPSSPSDLWNVAVRDAVASINASINAVAPIYGRPSHDSADVESGDSHIATESVRTVIHGWLGRTQNTVSEELRVDMFLQVIHGLTTYLVCLFDGPAPAASTLNSTANASPYFSAEINVAAVLDLVETMLSFSVAAEAVYHGTKKRLRREPVDGGSLSSAVLAGEVGNAVKLCGLTVLGSFLDGVGGPSLLPFAERVRRISCACLLTSSSTSLRKAVDPTSAILQVDGKRKRWLHASIRLRAAAIRAFEKCTLLFGISMISKSSSSYSEAGMLKETERSVSLVGGCIIESLVEANGGSSSDWGSSAERTNLVTAAAECLAACLVSGGEFLSESLRALVDSVANVCLLAVVEDNPVASASTVKTAFLAFGTACLTTPWPDGAASSIADALFAASRACEQDPDPPVALAAASALRVCDMSSAPRVPALRVVTRSATSAGANHLLSIDSLIDKLADARKSVQESEASRNKTSKVNSSTDTPVASYAGPVTDQVVQPANNAKLDAMSKNGADPAKESAATAETFESLKDEEEKDGRGEELLHSNGHSNFAHSVAPKSADAEGKDDDDGDDDADFPMIVDCGPDKEDVDSDGE